MTQTMKASSEIAEGDRIYATADIYFGHGDYLDVPRGVEGTVTGLSGHDAYDLYVEFDNGLFGAVSSGDVGLVDPPSCDYDDTLHHSACKHAG